MNDNLKKYCTPEEWEEILELRRQRTATGEPMTNVYNETHLAPQQSAGPPHSYVADLERSLAEAQDDNVRLGTTLLNTERTLKYTQQAADEAREVLAATEHVLTDTERARVVWKEKAEKTQRERDEAQEKNNDLVNEIARLRADAGDNEKLAFAVIDANKKLDQTREDLRNREIELAEVKRKLERGHVCTAACQPNSHVAFVGRHALDEAHEKNNDLVNHNAALRATLEAYRKRFDVMCEWQKGLDVRARKAQDEGDFLLSGTLTAIVSVITEMLDGKEYKG